MTESLAESLALLPEAEQAGILANLSDREASDLEYDWAFWGRPEQFAPPGEWSTWMALCGRGWGKTEAGAQWIRQRVAGGARSIAIVAETQKDLEEVMVPRIIRVHPPKDAPSVRYKPVRLSWPNGAIALGYNGTEPDQLRGPEFDTAWVDELAKYRDANDLWDMLQFTMRRGEPRVFVTTTPRPIPIIRAILADTRTVATRGNTFDNAANLPRKFLEGLEDRYAGTRLGRQELNAEILDDLPGSLWTRAQLDACHVPAVPEMVRIVVAIDPSGTSGDSETADDVGIIVAGKGIDGRGYVLADLTCNMSPADWARRAVAGYHDWSANLIVAERNYGGAMVEAVVKTADRNVPYKEVVASRGKSVRAEPISALYEQGKISHAGAFPHLEDQMCMMGPEGYVGKGSPDRLDAMVWAFTELMLEPKYHRLTF